MSSRMENCWRMVWDSKRKRLGRCREKYWRRQDRIEIAEGQVGDFVIITMHSPYTQISQLERSKKNENLQLLELWSILDHLGVIEAMITSVIRIMKGKDTNTWYRLRTRYSSMIMNGRTILFDKFRGSILPFGVFIKECDKWGYRFKNKEESKSSLIESLSVLSSVFQPVNWISMIGDRFQSSV